MFAFSAKSAGKSEVLSVIIFIAIIFTPMKQCNHRTVVHHIQSLLHFLAAELKLALERY